MKERTSAYLPHIDGLRFIAVISVLLFHFSVPGLGGGYVGVDVFFVISGYLITKIIVDEVVTSGRFDFRRFYSRRISRILPALIATLAATTVLAVASLTPSDLVAYGKSLVASALSLSNLLFWSESGYFDAASQTKPLLHTWSLSVEEQFYLFWPAFIFICYRLFGRKGLIWSIVAAGMLSFGANHLAVASQSLGYKSDLFFLPHFRVFEFAIGAVGCFVVKRLPTSRGLHEAMMALGLGLIAYSIFTLEEGVVFPYLNALLPCLGALLAISAGGSRLTGALLTNPLAVWIGKISYSLYLTHWPVVVLVEQYLPTAPWALKFVVMASLSLLTAIVLHHQVEVRFRYAAPAAGRGSPVRKILLASIAFCGLGVFVSVSNGMTWRYNYFTPGALGAPAVVSTAAGSGEDAAEPASDEAPGQEALRQASAVDGAAPSATGEGETDTPREEVAAGARFKPLGAAEIDAGKQRRFAGLASACSIGALDKGERCFMERPAQVLIFGNSHEPDAFNAFNYIYAGDKRVNLITFGTVNDCEIKFAADTVYSTTSELACKKRFEVLNSDEFVRKIDVAVYNTHQGFDPVAVDLWAVLELLKKRNPAIKIVAIGSYLQTTTDCSSLYNKYGSYDACKREEFVNYFNPKERFDTTVPQVKSLDYLYISKYQLLCGSAEISSCATFANGEPAFYDQHHLSLGFARYLGRRIVDEHRADLAGIGLPVPETMK